MLIFIYFGGKFQGMREAGELRINPPFYSSRRYYLRQLRKGIEEVIDKYIKDQNRQDLLDYGCGNSPYEPLISCYINHYYKADIDDNPAINVRLTEEGRIPVLDQSYDIILSTQVLEHVEDPSLYLSESQRALKRDGILILTTHGYWMYHPDPADYWRWTSAGLSKIIRNAGFEILYFKGILGRNASGLQLFQDGFLFKTPSFLRPCWSIFMQTLIAISDKFNSKQAIDRDACTYIVVAKPL